MKNRDDRVRVHTCVFKHDETSMSLDACDAVEPESTVSP